MKRASSSSNSQQVALLVEVAHMPRCSQCGERTPRHAEYKRAGQMVRVPLCGWCARKDDK